MYVSNCVEVEVKSTEEAYEVLLKGKSGLCFQNKDIKTKLSQYFPHSLKSSIVRL